MKWAERRKRALKYYVWEDILYAVFITLIIIAIILALIIVPLVILMNPKAAPVSGGVNFRSARRLAAVVVRSEKVTTRASEPVKVLYMEVSAYSPTVAECDAAPLVTASGHRVRVGGIAADLRVLPFGSLVIIPNYNNGDPCVVTDTGSAIKGNKLDVFMWSTDEAIHFGRRRNVRVEVLYIPKGAA